MKLLVTTSLLSLVLGACAPSNGDATDHDHDVPQVLQDVQKLVANLSPTDGNDTRGTVTFTSSNGGVTVQAEVTGLQPGKMHAIHVHEFGDISAADGTAAGGHYNPEGHDHGLPSADVRHAGDFGNLEADESGQATFTITVENASLAAGMNPFIGRSIIVHEGEVDGGQPTGSAGPRIALGVIGVAKP